MNSCGFYSFNGASVDAKIKNIYIHYFQNQSENFKANLDRDLTEKLTDLILDQTNLQISNNNYEIEIIGKITEYEIFPI